MQDATLKLAYDADTGEELNVATPEQIEASIAAEDGVALIDQFGEVLHEKAKWLRQRYSNKWIFTSVCSWSRESVVEAIDNAATLNLCVRSGYAKENWSDPDQTATLWVEDATDAILTGSVEVHPVTGVNCSILEMMAAEIVMEDGPWWRTKFVDEG